MMATWFGSPLVEEDDTVPELLAHRSPPTLFSTQAEDVALLSGLKPLIFRAIPPEDLHERIIFFQQRGLFAEQVHIVNPSGIHNYFLIAGRRESNTKEITYLLANGPFNWAKRDHQRIAGLLGYPPCCANSFSESTDEYSRMERAAARTHGPGDPWLNVLDPAIFRLISWEPCTFRCDLSRVYAQRLLALLIPHFRTFLLRTKDTLSATRLYLSPSVQLSMIGEFWDDGFFPRYIAPTARDYPPPSSPSRQEERMLARALRETRAAQKITSKDGILSLDGTPWAQGFLVRFHG